jgi:molybdopterin-guanine dinucleotide biosynthesis protein A
MSLALFFIDIATGVTHRVSIIRGALVFTRPIGCWYDCDMEPVSAIIQAGGQSRRMGTDKALIDYQGRPILAHVIDTLRQLSDDVLVVSNRSDVYGPLGGPFGACVVPDYDPPSGPLGGIAAGLAAMNHELAIVVACDMPFLNLDLLRYLIERATDFDAVVPLTGDQFEPLHAIYRRSCLAAIQHRLANNERRVISFFQDVRLSVIPEAEWHVIDPTGRSLSNLNTPDDLALLK